MLKLDDRDLKILSILSTEGRISKAALAERVNLTAAPCWERLKRLEEAGIITGYHADIALRKIAPHVVIFMAAELEGHRSENFRIFERTVERLEEIVACWAVGGGFDYILHGMNPERVLIAAEAVGLGKLALARAADYAKTRIVFNRPIGMNQAIQHPLAKNWMNLEAAWMMVLSAAWQYDKGLPCGAAANAAKYLAGEAGFDACQQAIMTHGGFGYAKEFHVERYLR